MRNTIDMAREAGHMVIDDYYTNGPVRAFSAEQLKTFEALVRADEREEWEMVCNQHLRHIKQLKKRHKTEVLVEREACAQVAEKEAAEWFDNTGVANFIADAIRARGNT